MLKKVLMSIVIIGVFLVVFFIQPAIVSGQSMMPTLEEGDYLFYLKTTDVKRGDIVVVNYEDKELLVKRVIGVENDTVSYGYSSVAVNDEELKEDYILEKNWGKGDESDIVEVQNNEIFVMGDNRNNSLDSRYIGVINKKDLKGKILFDVTDHIGLKGKTILKTVNFIKILLIVSLLCVFIYNKIKKNKVKGEMKNECE